MRKKFRTKKIYKYSKIMKIIAFIGGLMAFFSLFIGIMDWTTTRFTYPTQKYIYISIERAIVLVIGLVGAILTFFCVLRPNNPLPFNWRILLIIGTWIIVIGIIDMFFGFGTFVDNLIILFTVLGGLVVIFAFIIGLAEDIALNQPNLTKW